MFCGQLHTASVCGMCKTEIPRGGLVQLVPLAVDGAFVSCVVQCSECSELVYRPPMQAGTREIARFLFEEYAAAQENKNFMGHPIPAWDELTPSIQRKRARNSSGESSQATPRKPGATTSLGAVCGLFIGPVNGSRTVRGVSGP